jgi:anti-sigma B factor antagonist
METIQEQVNGATILKLNGRLDAYTAAAIKNFFLQMDANAIPRIVVNLSQVDFIDSTGLATLTIGMQLCQQQRGDLVLCSLQQPVRVIFELTCLDQLFTIFANQEDAIASLQVRPFGRTYNEPGDIRARTKEHIHGNDHPTN